MSHKDFSLPPLELQASQAPLQLPPDARYAFVEAAWHADIVQQARAAFLTEMARHGVAASAIDVIGVPGAFEIPLHAQQIGRASCRERV